MKQPIILGSNRAIATELTSCTLARKRSGKSRINVGTVFRFLRADAVKQFTYLA